MVAFPSIPLPSDAAPTGPADPLGRELRRPHEDRWAAILPNTTPGQAPFKLQFFGLSGLAGHRPYATPQAALDAARRAGYTEPDPGALHRLSRTPAWKVIYDTPAGPPALALTRLRRALAALERHGVTVETITLGRGAVPPRIVISGPPPALAWRCYAWGCDDQGRYRRVAAALAGCQLVREVRDYPIHAPAPGESDRPPPVGVDCFGPTP